MIAKGDIPLDGFGGRITVNPEKMGGKPCIRGMRITVQTIRACFADGMSADEILAAYPYLELADLDAATRFASSPPADL